MRQHRGWNLACCLAIILAGIGVYANHLFNPLQFDSVIHIAENPDFQEPARMLSGEFVWRQYFSRGGLFWTLGLNAWLHGLEPFGFHLVNLGLHLINALLVFFVTVEACLYFQIGWTLSRIRAAALFTGLLFLVHPIQTESVVYIISRSELLAGTFYLTAFLVFQRFLARRRPPGTGPGRAATALAILAGVGIGYSVKPTVATLPVMLALYYVWGLEPGHPVREWLRRHAWRLLGAVMAGAGWLAWRLATDPFFLAGSAAAVEVIGRRTYFLTQPVVVVFYYLKLLLFPFNLNVDPDIPPVLSPADPRLWAALAILILGLTGLARRRRIYLFLALWFLVVLSPSSSFVTLLDLAAEHRVYLASYGMILLGVLAVFHLADRVKIRGWPRAAAGWAAAGVLILLTLGAAGLTIQRNAVWATELGLWHDAEKKSPRKIRPLINLGRAYGLAGDAPRAISYYERSIQLNPNFFQANYNLAVLYLEQGRTEEALSLFKRAVALKPEEPEVHARLGEFYIKERKYEQADFHLRRVVELKPRNAEAFRNLGFLNYYFLNRRREGIHFLMRSLHLNPDQPQAALMRQLTQTGG